MRRLLPARQLRGLIAATLSNIASYDARFVATELAQAGARVLLFARYDAVRCRRHAVELLLFCAYAVSAALLRAQPPYEDTRFIRRDARSYTAFDIDE